MTRRNQNRGNTLTAAKLGAPTFRSPYEGRFKNPEEARHVLLAVARFLQSQNPTRRSPAVGDAIGFAIEAVEVHPSPRLKRIRMETQFASGTVLLHLPCKKGESDDSLDARVERVLARFAPAVFEAQMRSAWEFYWALDDEGKRRLLERYGPRT